MYEDETRERRRGKSMGDGRWGVGFWAWRKERARLWRVVCFKEGGEEEVDGSGWGCGCGCG